VSIGTTDDAGFGVRWVGHAGMFSRFELDDL
jgi:hypothetical protein